MTVQVLQGDARAIPLPDCSVDAVVCDPPYGLEFMGKEWDRLEPGRLKQRWAGSERKSFAPGKRESGADFAGRMGANPSLGQHRNQKCKRCGHYKYSGNPCSCDMPEFDLRSYGHAQQVWHEQWAREAYRVLKPGGHLLAFGGTRTYHRMACAVEDAGFEIRDSLHWLYGQGFPKSRSMRDIGHPELGTALKPAHEPIVLARKPLSEKTVAANVLRHGTGAVNVDRCRVRHSEPVKLTNRTADKFGRTHAAGQGWRGKPEEQTMSTPSSSGRWPPNLLLSHLPGCRRNGTKRVKGIKGGGGLKSSIWTESTMEHKRKDYGPYTGYVDADGKETVDAWDCQPGCPVKALGEQSGMTTSSGGRIATVGMHRFGGDEKPQQKGDGGKGDRGTAARFFPQFAWGPDDWPFLYCPKASRKERNAGCEALSARKPPKLGMPNDPEYLSSDGCRRSGSRHAQMNSHPTVKPVALMKWLIRLVTPPGGLILDPFCGSGSTGVAAVQEGANAVLLDNDPESVPIAQARIAHALDVQRSAAPLFAPH